MTSNATSEVKFPGVALQDLDIVKQYLSVHDQKQLHVLFFHLNAENVTEICM